MTAPVPCRIALRVFCVERHRITHSAKQSMSAYGFLETTTVETTLSIPRQSDGRDQRHDHQFGRDAHEFFRGRQRQWPVRHRRSLQRGSEVSGRVHFGRNTLGANHRRRHSGFQFDGLWLHRRPADRRQHRVDRRAGRDSRTSRTGRVSSGLASSHGEMQFDSADVAGMFANGTWTNVILHEMGHILGIGTLWSTLGLKNGAGDYIGTNALREYRTLSGTAGATWIPI